MSWIGVITNAGRALLAGRGERSTLVISRAAAGAGNVPEVSLMAQTTLADERQTMSIISKETTQAGMQVELQITPPDTGYGMSQYGIWARLDGGDEAMLAIFQSDSEVEIPSKIESPDFLATFTATLAVSNQGTFEAVMDPNALVSRKTMEEYVGGVAAGKADLEGGQLPTAQLPDGIVLAVDEGLPQGQIGYNADTLEGHGASYFARASDLATLETGIGDKLSRYPNGNILDNWYLARPVNQRGQAEYTGRGYGIDRWRANVSTTVVAVEDGYLRLSSPTDNGGIYQNVDLTVTEDVKVTLSVLYKGDMYLTYWAGPIKDVSSSGWDVASFTYDVPAGTDLSKAKSPYLGCKAGKSADIIAVKLELGDRQTLAHQENGVWVLNEAPDYGTELLRCQRYQYVISSASYVPVGNIYSVSAGTLNVITSMPMLNKKPAVNLTGSFRVVNASNGAVTTINNPSIRYVLYNEGKLNFEIINLDEALASVGTYGFLDTNDESAMAIFDAGI